MTILGIVVIFLGLVVAIALHEVGHLVPAKLFKVHTPQYMIGFGPTLVARTFGDTEYGIKAFPLGGFVRMSGMYAPAAPGVKTHRKDGKFTLAEEARQFSVEDMPKDNRYKPFYALSVPKKIIVMFSGPLMNLFLSFLSLVLAFSVLGVKEATTSLNVLSPCLTIAEGATITPAEQKGNTNLSQCPKGAYPNPAYASGLRPGDQILAWGDVTIKDWETLRQLIRGSGGSQLPVTIEREGRTQVLSVGVATLDSKGEAPYGFLGISPTFERVHKPLSVPFQYTGEMLKGTAAMVPGIPMNLWNRTVNLFSDAPGDPGGMVGIIGVGRIAADIGSADNPQLDVVDRFGAWLSLIASFNMALFVLNLIPLLPLDGGHIAGALWEGLRVGVARLRKRPRPAPTDIARALPLTYMVVAILVVMMVILVVADIVKPISLG
ncbi:MAG: site-2 protease family protein [Actinomycetaceae bacterium]|nr:site-2 protease family protein [Actinomycetaceae bacterium]